MTFFVVGAISLIGVFELLRVIQMEKSALGVIVYTGSVLYYLLLLLGLEQYVMQLALLVLIFAYCSVRFLLFQSMRFLV